jgi:hypothetical protein
VHYGKTANKAVVKSVRLPQKLFRDYSETGSLFSIMKVALQRIPLDLWADYNVLDSKNTVALANMISEMEQILLEVRTRLATSTARRNILFLRNAC